MLADWQYSYGGLVFGVGLPVRVTEVEGLDGFEVRDADADLPRQHGAAPGRAFVSKRQVLFTLRAFGEQSDVEASAASIRRAFAPEVGVQPLRWKRPGQPLRRVSARPHLLANQLTPARARDATPRVALICPDPRIYSDAQHSVIVPVYEPGGGFDYPVDYPKEFTVDSSREAVAHNAGSADAWPLVRIYGPAPSGFTLSNRTTGQDLTVTSAVADGQILTVDMTSYVTASGGLVVSLGSSSRYGDWAHPREPWGLAPGDNVLRLNVNNPGAATRGVVTWRDTSLG